MQGGQYPISDRYVDRKSVEMVPWQLLQTRKNLIFEAISSFFIEDFDYPRFSANGLKASLNVA